MTTTHTPGPWFAFCNANGAFDVGSDGNQHNADILCSRYEWLEREMEMHANARLIAAAPDMLKQLQDAYTVICNEVADGEDTQLATSIRELVAKVIT